MTAAEGSSRLRLYCYQRPDELRFPPQFCYLVNPLLFGSPIEDRYAVAAGAVMPRFFGWGASGWRTDPRWDGFRFDPSAYEIVDEPGNADYIVFPYQLEEFVHQLQPAGAARVLRGLPHFRGHEARHVFLTFHDYGGPFEMRSVMFRASVRAHLRDPATVTIPYPVLDYRDRLDFDLGRCAYQTSFCGTPDSHPVRPRLVASVRATPGLVSHLDLAPGFHGHLPAEVQRERHESYVRTTLRSLTVLCPVGGGANTFRFFEVLSLGRIPVLVTDGCELPLEDEIDYDAFVLRIDLAAVAEAGQTIRDFLARHRTEDLEAKCRAARSAWERHFSTPGLPALLTRILRRRLAA